MVAAGELASTTLVAAWLAQTGFGRHVVGRARDVVHLGPIGLPRRRVHLHGAGNDVARSLTTSTGERTWWSPRASLVDTPTAARPRWAAKVPITALPLLAVAVGAEEVTIWKDVPGMMNADPNRHPEAVTVPRVDHAEAIELSYYGASVIHPRTVKPLQHAGLPLWVKSFVNPEGQCTCIDAFPGLVPDVPMFIWRENQTWLEVYTDDGSFLVEDHLTELFGALDRAGVHARLMQQSATHFGVLDDRDDAQMANVSRRRLGAASALEMIHGLTLLTVRHGDANVLDDLTQGRGRSMEQRAADPRGAV